MRRIVVVVAVALAVTVLPACANRDRQVKDLRKAIRETRHLAHRFEYTVSTPEGRTDVLGIVEDDFRFKARVAFDGTDAYDQVVNDDLLAVRFADPARITQFVNPATASAAEAKTDLTGVTVGTALRARRWVLDAEGAPLVTAAAADQPAGRDPLLDALTVLDYVDKAATESVEVKRFDPESLNPIYNSSEDTFPRPERGSGVDRYDMRRPDLPPVSSASRGGEAAFPRTQHFRRMAVYVKNGLVIAVREAVDLRGKSAEDFVKYQRALLREAKLPQKTRDAYEKLVQSAPRRELGIQLLRFLNQGLIESGLEPIAIRTMSLEMSELGGGLAVSVPTDGVIKGSLDALLLARHGGDDAAVGTSGSTATTATTQATAPTTVP